MICPRPIPPRALTLSLLACAVAFVVAGCNAPGKPGPEPDSKATRPEQVLDFATLYSKNCAACHGENGRNGAAIALNNPVYLYIAGSQNIQRITADGVPNTAMPPFATSKGGTLTDQQISILTSGMIKTWGDPARLPDGTPPPYAATTPGDAGRGQQAFATYCAQCHGNGGTGGVSATTRIMVKGLTREQEPDPNIHTGSLVDPAYLALISDQGLRSSIVAGRFEETPHSWRTYASAPPTTPITDQQITDVVAWLTAHRIATPGQVYHEHP
jgi:cytochrome c oxidase cbb3-type subunit 3/ubiquinol-cytochrome c reductase cytochrome c subunit